MSAFDARVELLGELRAAGRLHRGDLHSEHRRLVARWRDLDGLDNLDRARFCGYVDEFRVLVKLFERGLVFSRDGHQVCDCKTICFPWCRSRVMRDKAGYLRAGFGEFWGGAGVMVAAVRNFERGLELGEAMQAVSDIHALRRKSREWRREVQSHIVLGARAVEAVYDFASGWFVHSHQDWLLADDWIEDDDGRVVQLLPFDEGCDAVGDLMAVDARAWCAAADDVGVGAALVAQRFQRVRHLSGFSDYVVKASEFDAVDDLVLSHRKSSGSASQSFQILELLGLSLGGDREAGECYVDALRSHRGRRSVLLTHRFGVRAGLPAFDVWRDAARDADALARGELIVERVLARIRQKVMQYVFAGELPGWFLADVDALIFACNEAARLACEAGEYPVFNDAGELKPGTFLERLLSAFVLSVRSAVQSVQVWASPFAFDLEQRGGFDDWIDREYALAVERLRVEDDALRPAWLCADEEEF